MKKLNAIIVSFFICSQMTSAQITITAASGYAPGDFYTIQPCNPKLSELSKNGADVHVDYSDVTTLGVAKSIQFVKPETTPNGSLFPTATVAFLTPPNTYTYYTSTSGKLNTIGITSSLGNKVYQNPGTVFTFPTKYGDKFNDEFVYEFTRNGVRTKRSGIMEQKADAYGNITTPAGTFPYLRIETLEEIADSMFQGTELKQTVVYLTYSYVYMNSNYKAPLFSYYEIFNNNTGEDVTTVFYNISPPTGIRENETAISNEMMYPNPAIENEITVSFHMQKNEPVSFQIMDINGKSVSAKSTNYLSGGDQRISLNVEDLAPGCYAVLMSSELSGTKAIKFVKQ